MYYLVPVVIVIVVYLLFKKNRHKVSLQPMPALKKLLVQHINYYNELTDEDKAVFEHKISTFLSDVNIEGVGLTVTDTDRVMVAASAVIPIFGFKDWRYRNVTNVLLYPDTFDKEFAYEGGEGRNIMGMVGSGYMNGQMILSRRALEKGFSKNAGKENTGIHEFVHLLDKTDGATDGIPEGFLQHEYVTPWVKMMHQEIHKIEAGKSDIGIYAATNEAEFFAVTSEYFFEKPHQFKAKHPELYDMLSKTFGQDPEGEDAIH
ncbi:M90 family metallopeptidase [Mucilaginibacter segetis]|uniref:Zinc-dependent peptidase n=1 Tax=Mucilaginibacter segetis TaxID=2793071 RepID=A0A934PXC4_9SPHI|nr:M90 family metallopeptidase [Mucilaginibacter segetis]MBK0381181.1 zinc-dependent peptidase [Mucilaginibacter segetis]